MHLKVFVKLKKTLKTLSSGQKTQKTQKKTKKKQKKTKKPTGLVFLKNNPGFFPTLVQLPYWQTRIGKHHTPGEISEIKYLNVTVH